MKRFVSSEMLRKIKKSKVSTFENNKENYLFFHTSIYEENEKTFEIRNK